jgi:glycerol-3-phosphate acyltransferase PlsY
MGLILLKIGLFLFAYLLGSIPSGLIIGKIFLKINLKEHGSKNIGASNAFRVMGVKLGLLTLFFDVIKGAIPVILAKYVFPATIDGFEVYLTMFDRTFDYAILFGVAAILGHTFSIFLKFEGGKAVATSLGVVFALTPIIGVLALIIYFIVVFITKYASLGSTFGCLVGGVGATIQFLIQGIIVEQTFVLVMYWALILLIVIRHIPNYKRLIAGTERKLEFKKKKQPEENNETNENL